MTIAASGQAAKTPHRIRLTKEPHFQPSILASGLPSSTMLGVATQVLKKSAHRLNNSIIRQKKYCRLPTATRSSMFCAYSSRCSVTRNDPPGFSTERKKQDL